MYSKRKLTKIFAEKIAQLQCDADYWYYISKDKNHHNMASFCLDQIIPVTSLIYRLHLNEKKIYKKALKLYDFRNSGTKGYEPDRKKILAYFHSYKR